MLYKSALKVNLLKMFFKPTWKVSIDGYTWCSRPNSGISILDQAYGDQNHDQLSDQQVTYKLKWLRVKLSS